ncbi:endolysin [Gordonia phage Trine]|uniref:N-acetylmuramoyl-L-alanine amidase n=1 Tax=Gordonia phage Trine TaxID=2201431 RepID=A0A2Z4Q8W9_9CAUD|nr:endolysin [Gordonia phage Trine]AWY06522.1 lysin A [Gordonia phage Trine]
MGDPIWLEKAIRAEGVTIDVYPGAYERGHGDFGNGYLKPFMHHTGSFGETPRGIAQHPTLGLASQIYLGKDGKATLCGVGIAWHAGAGSGYGLPTNNGNAHSIGIEAAHNGTSPWSEAQYGSYLRIVRAINRAQNHALDDVVAHKEYGAIQGKWDPGNLDMKLFRQRLKAKEPEKVQVNLIELEAKQNPWVGVRHAKPGAEGETKVGPDGRGRMVRYDNAHIYYHPTTGAFVVPHGDPAIPGSGIFEAWSARNWERGELGYPVRDFSHIEGNGVKGAVQAFQRGVLYVADDPAIGAHVVRGVIGQRWALEGWEDGPLGWPISDEYPNGTGGVRQDFQHGSLEWDPSGAVKRIGQEAVKDLTVVNSSGLPLAVTEGVELITA